MQSTRRHVVVVGGGLAGVAAAYRIRAARPDVTVTVLEGSPRLGGKLATAAVGGVVVDVGAESILNRRPEGVDLARAVGLADEVVHPATASASLWTRGEMVPLPRSLMGVPGDLSTLAGVLEPDERPVGDGGPVAVLAEGEDVSVGALVEGHLGAGVVDRLVEPMLGGVYAGHARLLSVLAAVPALVARFDGTRSLPEAADAAMTPATTVSGGTPVPVFAGIRGGVGRLPDAIASASGARVETGATVREIRRSAAGWVLVVGSTHQPREVTADAVVLAVPAAPAARLLARVAPAAAADLAAIEHASMAVVTLAVRAADLPPTTGSGFLVPPVERRAVKGATYSFAKWDWVRASAAADGLVLLRCSLGRHREEQVLQRSDEGLVALALGDLSDAIGLRATPVDVHVQRWGGGLPQYAVGHVARIARIREAVSRVSGLAVCGAAYDGVGIPAVIASAYAAAEQVLAGLPAGPADPPD